MSGTVSMNADQIAASVIQPPCTAVLYLSEHRAVQCSLGRHGEDVLHSVTLQWQGDIGHLPLI